MSRFLPSVLVANALQSSGVDLPALRKRAAALRDREASGPAPTTFGQAKPVDGDADRMGYTYPTGTPSVMKTPELASSLQHGVRWEGPVFDADRLKSMTDEGLSKLASMQHADGGWGWWTDDRSEPYMTAYVVQGLAMAQQRAKVAVDDGVLSRGYAYLATDIVKRDDERDIAVWEAYALSFKAGGYTTSVNAIVSDIYAKRDRLSAYGQALLALTLNQIGRKAEAQTVCRNLRNTANIDRENGTASWPNHRYGGWWCWWNNDTETTAWALRAFTAIEPDGDLAPMLANWIVRHKRGNAWTSTKETAMAVYALTDYAKTTHEFAPNYTVTAALGDKIARKYTIDTDNALFFDNQFLVPPSLLTDGKQTVKIIKEGKGRLYWTAAVQYVTTEDKIAGSGGELKVERRYYRLTPKMVTHNDGSNDTYNALDYNRQMLADGTTLHSGDLIEVEMIVDAKNDYDYVVLEDGKPAGCEPVELRSGCRFTDGLFATEELRDTKTVFFVSHLPQGSRVLRYRLRAEAPGLFHALPTNAYACYAPDVRALSNSWSVDVRDRVDGNPAVARAARSISPLTEPAR